MQGNSTQTTILRIDPERPQPSLIRRAAQALRAGRLLIFPTDTVYGIGLLVSSDADPRSLRAAKQRPQSQPLALLVADTQALVSYGRDIPEYAQTLAKQHWPGALTLVVPAGASLPPQFCAEDGSVALRVPDSQIALALLRASGAIATSSANLSGAPPALSLGELDSLLASSADLLLDGGTLSGQPSTLVSCLGDEPIMLRRGSVWL